jgi:hypothetical protein
LEVKLHFSDNGVDQACRKLLNRRTTSLAQRDNKTSA